MRVRHYRRLCDLLVLYAGRAVATHRRRIASENANMASSWTTTYDQQRIDALLDDGMVRQLDDEELNLTCAAADVDDNDHEATVGENASETTNIRKRRHVEHSFSPTSGIGNSTAIQQRIETQPYVDLTNDIISPKDNVRSSTKPEVFCNKDKTMVEIKKFRLQH